MTWRSKYWDIIDQLYWWPRYLGLTSINQRHWRIEGERLSIPLSMVNRSGPLYTRGMRSSELIQDLHGKEEILNHVFDLTFAIAPDVMIEACFAEPLGFRDAGPFESIGREVQNRYRWGAETNVTQQDGFFVSERSAIGVELKLGSSSWPGQVAKYAALLAWEELQSGRKSQLGLVFIAPESARATHWRKCGLEGDKIDASFLDQTWTRPLPGQIQQLFADERERVADVLDRLQLAFVSWEAFRDRLTRYREPLDRTQPGDQALGKLIDGFVAQLNAHRSTGIG
ncbi:MAG: hypothetical protein J0L52_12310 [Caulobacterales bacterium]|nr:hypothetical protein [Caulobacterales bacterium]